MTTPAKRSADSFDHRSRPPRSPKRRKTTTPGTREAIDLTSDTSKAEKDSTEVTDSDEVFYAAKSIIRERESGVKKEYLITWVPHPKTGKRYRPTWEPVAYANQALIEEWEERKHANSNRNSSGSSFQPSKPPTSSRSASLDGLRGLSSTLRSKRTRRVVEDSSSIVDSDTEAEEVSHTPSLALSAPSAADDWESDPTALEISETQQQPLTIPNTVAIKIPASSLDRTEYLSFHGSQLSPTYTSPLTPPSGLTSKTTFRSSGKQQSNSSSYSPSRQLRDSLRSMHKSLLESLRSPSQSPQQIEVPASSDLEQQQSNGRNPRDSSASIGQQSGPHPGSSSNNHQPSSISVGDSSANNLLSSAQPVSQDPYLAVGLSNSLNPIESGVVSQPSSPWAFQTQVARLQNLSGQLKQSRNLQSPLSSVEPDGLEPRQHTTSPGQMDLPAVRQSPRLQSATMATGTRSPRPSPRPAPREQLRRAMSPQKLEEVTSINKAATGNNQTYGSHLTPDVRPTQSRLSQEYTSAQAHQESGIAADSAPQASFYDNAFASSAYPIQQSIEEEPTSSAEEHNSIASKASSSQVSLLNERAIPQVDGISLPVKPVTGPAEYAIPLPAEGKIQSSYTDIINSKRKTILKFVHRRDSVGSGNGHSNRTVERNEMIELIDLLHDTVTHFDLGLPGFATQYSIDNERASAYAQYAGSKFVFLGHLIDILMRVDCSLIIASKAGHVQDLIVDFLKIKRVHVHRFDRPGSARSVTPDVHQATLKVDVIGTSSDFEINVSPRPALMIAFDSTFDGQSPHIARIRELHSQGRNRLLPVLHLLVQNSSEHVDRCLRKAMPSPQRLKLLVRATYQARTNLGGSPSYVPAIGDEPEGRSMDIHDLQLGVRKSPNRKLNMVAAIVARAALSDDFAELWTLGDMPEVQYEELEDTPPQSSRVTTAANTATATPRDGRARSRTPLSRAGTPSGRKRLLDVGSASSVLSKRVRLSPARDLTPTVDAVRDHEVIEQLRDQLRAVTAELATEKGLRLKAEDDRDRLQKRLNDYVRDHSALMHRYEKRQEKIRELDKQTKQFQTVADFNKMKHEKTVETNTKLKEQVGQLQGELTAAREDLKKEGGDVGALEEAREYARVAKESNAKLEKSVENTKRDFEFTRQQYQEASSRAAELGGQNSELEEQVQALKIQASDEKRRLREMNLQGAQRKDLAKIESLEQENRGMQVVIRKLEDRTKVLEKGRGVQTRGSSVQPPGSPGMVQTVVYGTRSRQASPAPGTVLNSSRDAREAAHTGIKDRVSGLRHER